MRALVHVVFLLICMLDEQWAVEIWEQDLSTDMQIGASTVGYDKVALYCEATEMVVNLQMPEDFSGVIYTRGSFYSRQLPCFLDPVRGKSFTLNIPFDQCGTENIGDKYKNILILQHDDELITPGDAAFVLECDFSKSRELTVSAELNDVDKKETRSSISLVDADPSGDETKKIAFLTSNTNKVLFDSNSIPKMNDEL
ncbi:uncharacterized protein LOC143426779 [Xylocopa sonorina]|uniref:uncharacterized protein LOC143426779 n=1 Tax=Xylocopa sonorina TaxID=1818115 RepID=UPI00403B0357